MKKIILTALAVATIQLAQAQQAPAPSQATETPTTKQTPTPEQAATRQTEHLQKVLTLNNEQKVKVYQASLTRNTAMQQLKIKNVENRKALKAEAKPVKEQFVKETSTSTISLITEQQKNELGNLLVNNGITEDKINEMLEKCGASKIEDMDSDYANRCIERLAKLYNNKKKSISEADQYV